MKSFRVFRSGLFPALILGTIFICFGGNLFLYGYIRRITLKHSEYISQIYLTATENRLNEQLDNLTELGFLCASDSCVIAASRCRELNSETIPIALLAQDHIGSYLYASPLYSYVDTIMIFNDNAMVIEASNSGECGHINSYHSVTSLKIYEDLISSYPSVGYVLNTGPSIKRDRQIVAFLCPIMDAVSVSGFLYMEVRTDPFESVVGSYTNPGAMMSADEVLSRVFFIMTGILLISILPVFFLTFIISRRFCALRDTSKSEPNSLHKEPLITPQMNGMFTNYAIICIFMHFDEMEEYEKSSENECTKLFEQVHDICSKICSPIFTDHIFCSPVPPSVNALYVFCWNISSSDWKIMFKEFAQKSSCACRLRAQVNIVVTATTCFDTPSDLTECIRQVNELVNRHYNDGSMNGLIYKELPPILWSDLSLSDLPSRLDSFISCGNTSECITLLDEAIKRISEVPHKKEESICLIRELYRIFSNTDNAVNTDKLPAPEQISTKDQLIHILEYIKKNLCARICSDINETQLRTLECARKYIRDNIDRHIMIQDIADSVCISTGYLSSLFKKQYDKTIMEYVNEVKIQKACELLKDGNYLIYEISHMLGFENAYYFTRVFKRYTGMTPTQYKRGQNPHSG